MQKKPSFLSDVQRKSVPLSLFYKVPNVSWFAGASEGPVLTKEPHLSEFSRFFEAFGHVGGNADFLLNAKTTVNSALFTSILTRLLFYDCSNLKINTLEGKKRNPQRSPINARQTKSTQTSKRIVSS